LDAHLVPVVSELGAAIKADHMCADLLGRRTALRSPIAHRECGTSVQTLEQSVEESHIPLQVLRGVEHARFCAASSRARHVSRSASCSIAKLPIAQCSRYIWVKVLVSRTDDPVLTRCSAKIACSLGSIRLQTFAGMGIFNLAFALDRFRGFCTVKFRAQKPKILGG
jgi:hypothetical protein